jgi:hypothetical protein
VIAWKLDFAYLFVCLMVFNVTFNNISVITWRSVLLVFIKSAYFFNQKRRFSFIKSARIIFLSKARSYLQFTCTSSACQSLNVAPCSPRGDGSRIVEGGFSMLFVLFCSFCLFSFVFVYLFVCLMVFNVTFNNISVITWRSVLLVEETGLPRL